jgi:hypothetical protein
MELLKDISVGAVYLGTLLVGVGLFWAIFVALRYVIERRRRAR